ncbi:F-box/kelch-repeat protein At3g06240-like [Papaver somniferum]|uniref:F-box/kelch-repeat protein At3g06240-like n=1 Tax=Papaver somniferum TaxID=3469 RepID=UPI000E6FBBC7|nr:F-box/kelch-repeat protein At3g06240-like [Papaver somniferum]
MDDPVKELKGVAFSTVLGSCNGLLCLGTIGSNPLILWNPSTREYKVIIPPDYHLLLSYGFGYDSKNNDYKLVCIDSIYFHAFTLKTGSWRKVVNTFPCVNLGERVGLLLNGALHFTQTTKSLGEFSKAVVAFDISSEKFMKFPLPKEFIIRQTDSTFNLRVLGDSLCLLICGVYTHRVDAWKITE